MEWQPIETAPRDGTLIVATGRWAFGYCIPTVVAWNTRTWVWASGPKGGDRVRYQPTHWLPLPPFPGHYDAPEALPSEVESNA